MGVNLNPFISLGWSVSEHALIYVVEVILLVKHEKNSIEQYFLPCRIPLMHGYALLF